MIKMIVMDMDGTLLNDEDEISSYTKKILIEAEKRGIKLVFASGRNYSTLINYGKQLKMDEYGGYFICSNGISIYNCKTKEFIYGDRLTIADQKLLFDMFKDYDLELMAVNDNHIYDFNSKNYLEEKKKYISDNNLENVYTGGPKDLIFDQGLYMYSTDYVSNFDNNVEADKVIVTCIHKEVLNDAIEKTKGLSSKYNANRTTDIWYEITSKNISKGIMLKKLCDNLSININDVMVFGDSENDLTMLNEVEESVCLINGMDIVKDKTKYVTDYDNNHDGLARFVEGRILKHDC